MADIIFLGTSVTDTSDWDQTDNWSTGTVPVNGDNVYFNNLSAPVQVLANIDQSAITLDSLTITAGFEGTIGDNTTFLQIGADNVLVGGEAGNGSQRINLDLGTNASIVDVFSTPTTGADTNFSPLRIKANSASTDIQINGSTSNVSIVDEDDATGTVGDINVVNCNSVTIGKGCTYTNFSQLSGTTEIQEAQGTIVLASGVLTLRGSSAVTSITQTDGTCISNTIGTITTYTGRGGTLDTIQSALARTITTLTKSPGFTLLLHSAVTITNDDLDAAFETYQISLSETT